MINNEFKLISHNNKLQYKVKCMKSKEHNNLLTTQGYYLPWAKFYYLELKCTIELTLLTYNMNRYYSKQLGLFYHSPWKEKAAKIEHKRKNVLNFSEGTTKCL